MELCLEQKWSPLFFAVITCNFEMVDMLVKHGAKQMQSASIPDDGHELHVAAQV